MSDDTRPAPTPAGATLGDVPTVSVAIPDPRGLGMGEVRLVEDGLIGREVTTRLEMS